jgi:spore coat protein U-like protein
MNPMLKLAAFAALWPGTQAWAAASCTLLSVPQMDFGSYSALGGADDAQADLLFSCIPDLLTGPTVSYTVELSPGTGHPSGFFPRRLVAGAYGLDYNLYTDPVRTRIWGDGSAGTFVAGGTCAAACSATVYGRVAAGQGVPAAQYRDDVLITLNF